jgi:hypothetical protein
MWHAVAPVSSGYDPILYESPEHKDVLVLNAGPGTIVASAWLDTKAESYPSSQLELRPGDQRVLSGRLVRAKYKSSTVGDFAAIAWRILK